MKCKSARCTLAGLASEHASAGMVGVNAAEQLCLACGLCCDGTLFDLVRLGAKDDASQLKVLGLPVKITRSRIPVTYFRQPCAALCANGSCSAYAARPGQCRTFECGVFKGATTGKITFASARQQVRQARRQADQVRQLLGALGEHDEDHSLTERFVATQKRLESGSANATEAEIYAKLSMAMHQLQLRLHERFHVRASDRK